jgi:hypothetical protein
MSGVCHPKVRRWPLPSSPDDAFHLSCETHGHVESFVVARVQVTDKLIQETLSYYWKSHTARFYSAYVAPQMAGIVESQPKPKPEPVPSYDPISRFGKTPKRKFA